MPLEIKKLPQSEVEISMEIPAEDFEKHYKEAFGEISKNISISGFRPGKIPQEILEKNVSSNDVLKKAAEMAIQKTYFSILKEKKIEAIGRPEIIITKIAKGDSFCFKVKTVVLPEITLPDYKKIASDINAKEKEGKKEKESKEQAEKAQQKTRIEILKVIGDSSEMEIPEILVVAEKKKMIGELKSSIENMGMKWQDYLNQIKKTEEDLIKEWQNDAETRVKYGLILRELAERENIQADDKEVDAEVEKLLKQLPGLDENYPRGYTYGIIRNEKVFRFLETC